MIIKKIHDGTKVWCIQHRSLIIDATKLTKYRRWLPIIVCGSKLEIQIPCAYWCIKLNPNNTIDIPIYYASRLMNSAKKNYATTKKEALAMIYVVKKFKDYLLGNSFILFVNHYTLL